MMWEGIDQRRFPRVSYKCLIKVSKEGQEEVVETYTENIGAGGICVVLEQEFCLFGDVSMEIFIDSFDKAILCNGTIVWVVRRRPADPSENVKYDTGIEFRDITEEERGLISKLVGDIMGGKT